LARFQKSLAKKHVHVLQVFLKMYNKHLRKLQGIGIEIECCSVALSDMKRDILCIETLNHRPGCLVHKLLG
jgi:hypothetical protein